MKGQKANTLGDTGCTGVVVTKKFIRADQLTGMSKKYFLLIDCTTRVCLVARVLVETPYYSGIVEATCMTDAICDLIIRNIPGALPPQHQPFEDERNHEARTNERKDDQE